MYVIGHSQKGAPVSLTDVDRSRHLHIVGSTGSGKSKLLEYLIRQDIVAGRGLCLLDPHGTLAQKIEQFCALRGMSRSRHIHVIRPGDSQHIPGFNPLRSVPSEALSVRVDAMVAACAQAWNIQDLSETPRLERVIRALFYALSAKGLTLAEGPALLRAGDPDGVRRALTENLPDPIFQFVWDELNSLSRREFAEQVESAVNRLVRFLAAPSMRLVVGQREHALDFRTVMDKGEIVLVDLGATTQFSPENARLLGTLIINDLFLTALGRDERTARHRPFSLYIDEAYDFLSGDIERVLDQTRKFGLHAVLAHQRLGQLRKQGEGIYNAVMSISNKIVFGGLADTDAEELTREIMREEINLERPKFAITTPVVIDEVPFWLESVSESEARSSSTAITLSESRTTQSSTSDSRSETFDGRGYMPRLRPDTRRTITKIASRADGDTYAYGSSTSNGETTSWSRTEGRSQTLRSVREERPVSYYSLEESLHLALLKLRTLPDRTAVVKLRGRRPVKVRIPDVRAMLNMPKTVNRFLERVAAASPYVAEIDTVHREISQRTEILTGSMPNGSRVSFWEAEGN